jgi:hypothetical protein
MLKRVCLSVFLVMAMACGGSSSSTPTTPTAPTPTTTFVAITGTVSLTSTNPTSQLKATATLSNGTTQDVSAQAAWQSSNQAVATASASGLVTAVGPGTASISAVYQGKTGTLLISVLNGPTIGSNCIGYPPASARLSMSGTINGVPWTAACISATYVNALGQFPSDFQLVGTDAQTSGSSIAFTVIAIRAENVNGPGTVPLLSGYISIGNATWLGTGTMTISTLTGTSASGTFILNATGIESKTVVGAFNVAF